MRDDAPRRLTRRDLRREATKASVIEAARKVFLDNGYEGTTIKAIADVAGVSPGTVLNAAPSKSALLVEILKDEYEAIGDSADRLEAALSGSVGDRIIALLQVHIEAQARHPELFAAAVGHSWLWTDPAYEEAFRQMDKSWGSISRALQRGVDAGELRADLDVDLAMRLLQDAYLGVVRRTRAENADRTTAAAMMRSRLTLILDGLKTR
jgi:AcrR family transcriptional regulator